MITQEYLRENIRYEPDTGLIFWIKPKRIRPLNKPIGYKEGKGYLRVKINSNPYPLARLIWLYLYGYFPEQIDHINKVKTDNRLINLRDVSLHENLKNRPIQCNNISQVTGVSWSKKAKKWTSTINISKKKKAYLGYYQDFVEACYTRWIAENLYQYHETHGR